MAEEISENINMTDKRKNLIDTYIRRQAVLKDKFPEIFEGPQSIQDEWNALTVLINALKSSQSNIWGPIIASDGCEVDKFVVQKYEDALAEYSISKDKNLEYISKEEEEAFKFPEIDFDALRTQMQEIRSIKDKRVLDNQITALINEPLPEEVRTQLYQLQEEVLAYEVSEEEKEDDIVAIVDESKFAQIYGRARGKIKQVFAKIKSFFKEKSQDKSNDSQDIDGRE